MSVIKNRNCEGGKEFWDHVEDVAKNGQPPSEPVASPQATRTNTGSGICSSLWLNRPAPTKGEVTVSDNVSPNAAQPAAGTTPHIHECDHETEGEHVCRCVICGKHIGTPPSEGTTPQAERPSDIVSEMLKLPCGCNADTDDPKGPIFWNPFNKAVQCHKCGHSYELARAVAPVETRDGKHVHVCNAQSPAAHKVCVCFECGESIGDDATAELAIKLVEQEHRIAEVVEDRRLTLNKFAAMEAEAAALRERERWIPVEEKLPEPLLTEFEGQFSDIVEMFDSANNYWHGFYDFKSGKWWISQGYEDDAEVRSIYRITHWKALSAAPEPK